MIRNHFFLSCNTGCQSPSVSVYGYVNALRNTHIMYTWWIGSLIFVVGSLVWCFHILYGRKSSTDYYYYYYYCLWLSRYFQNRISGVKKLKRILLFFLLHSKSRKSNTASYILSAAVVKKQWVTISYNLTSLSLSVIYLFKSHKHKVQ